MKITWKKVILIKEINWIYSNIKNIIEQIATN